MTNDSRRPYEPYNIDNDKNIIIAVLECYFNGESVKHNGLGNLGEKEAAKILNHLRMDDYCKKHNINFDDLTDEDYENKYFEELDEERGDY